jgi:anti-anti-sigma factor
MLTFQRSPEGEVILIGRLDSTTSEYARTEFAEISRSCSVNFAAVDYISSAGLSVLLLTQQRLVETGDELLLVKLRKPVLDVFKIAGFDRVFRIEE